MARILVVDDEPILRSNLSRYLTSIGYAVRTAGGGQEAMSAIDREPVDVLITDINMPDMDGIEILKALRERGSRVPVIAISGGGKFDTALLLDSANLLGAVRTLEKPFDLDQLRRVVEAVLADADEALGGA